MPDSYSGGFPLRLPSYAGSRKNAWQAQTGIYNSIGGLLNFKAALGRAGAGTGLVRIGVVGDSTAIGYAIEPKYSWPAMLQQKVLPALGFPSAGESAYFQNPATLNVFDSRIAYVNATPTNGLGCQMTSAGSVQFSSTVAGTIAEFQISVVGAGTATLTIDGASPADGNVTITSGGSGVSYTGGTLTTTTTTYQHCTITIVGLTNTTHVLKLSWVSGTIAPERYAVRGVSGVMLDNMGVAGSRTVDWIGSPYYRDSFYSPQGFAGQAGLFDLLITTLGINDANGASGSYSPTSIGTFKSNLAAIANGASGGTSQADKLIIAETYNAANPTRSVWETYLSAIWDVADSLNVPLIDLSARYTSSPATALFADGTHPTREGAFRIATDIGLMLAS